MPQQLRRCCCVSLLPILWLIFALQSRFTRRIKGQPVQINGNRALLFFNFCKIYPEIVNGAFYVCEWFLQKRTLALYYACSPDKISLRSFPKPLTSCKAVVTLSKAPNKLSRPSVRSIRKNMMDQKVAPGI